MDLRSGCPYWLVKNGLPYTYPTLEHNLTSDVAVVGGGVSGALIAWHLAAAGLQTVLLDRREIGWGSTAASTALLQYEIDTPMVKLAEAYGTEKAVRCYQACLEAIHKLESLTGRLSLDCGFQRLPSLFLAHRQSDLGLMRREFEARKSAGFKIQWWEPGKLHRTMGFKRPCALFSEDAAQVDAYRLTHAAIQQALQGGRLSVFDRTEVTSHHAGRSQVKLTTASGHWIKARHVIYATGYEVNELTQRKLMDLNSTYAFITEPLKPAGQKIWHRNALIWERADPYLYIRTTEDGRIICGGEDEPFQNPKKRDALLPAKIKTLNRKLSRLFPEMKTEIAFSWTGTFAETKDGLPYIGAMAGFPRAFFCLGFGGNGITYSLLAAEILRDAVLGKSHAYADLFSFDRKPVAIS